MIERRKSRVQGWGVFATETIPKNKRIIDYAGEKISNRESLKREARYLDKGHIWCFKLTNRTAVDAGVGGNIARFARTIRKGTELNYNYNTDGEATIKCRCRPDCPNFL